MGQQLITFSGVNHLLMAAGFKQVSMEVSGQAAYKFRHQQTESFVCNVESPSVALIGTKSILSLFGFRGELLQNVKTNLQQALYFCNFYGVTHEFPASQPRSPTARAEISACTT